MRSGPDHEGARVKPYYVMGITWVALGTITGLVSHHPLARLLFLAISFVMYIMIWEHIRCHGKSYVGEEKDWTKIHIKMVAKSKPLFYAWFGVLVQHLVWFKCDLVSLDHTYIVCGWIQGGLILSCSACSFFPSIMASYSTRNTIKSVMIGLIVLLPPWRTPWFEENVILLQLRWIVMLLLFGFQCVEALFSIDAGDGGGDRLNDVFFLRIAWVPVVQIVMLVFCIVPIVYFFYVILKIFSNTRMRDPFDPQSRHIFEEEMGIEHDPYDSHRMNTHDFDYQHGYQDISPKYQPSSASDYGIWNDIASR